LNVCADTGVSHYAQTREASADILRRLAPDMELPPSARGDFAIEKNRRSLIVVCALFVVLAYAVLDGLVFNDNALLDGDSLMTAMPFVTLLGLACFPYLKRGGVPSRESWALSMFLGVALAAAFVPFVKRADQWASRNSTVTVVYELKPGGRFVAVDGAAPALNYSRYADYWRQFEPGSLHEFQLIHGPLGFWQLREGNVSKRIRDFYEKGGTGG
jgi:hypothetical protein